MRAVKCDRCNNYFDYNYKETPENVNGVLLIDKDIVDSYTQRDSFDLCPDCVKDLKGFLDGKAIKGGVVK